MKIKELQQILKKKKIDLALFMIEDPNLVYFSGFKDGVCLVVPKNKPAKLFVHRMDTIRAKKASRVRIAKLPKGVRLFPYIKKHFKAKRIGISKSRLYLHFYEAMKKAYKKARFADISEPLKKEFGDPTPKPPEKIPEKKAVKKRGNK